MSTKSNVKSAMDMSGLLFQPHPQCDGWRTTRALSPEVVAFHNKEVEPAFRRLAIEYHPAGIEDENGYVPATDEYRVVSHDEGDFNDPFPMEPFDTRDEAIERVAEVMETVVENRAEK